MPVFLDGAHPLDQFKCDLCGEVFAKALIHEHHLIKKASGGLDTADNLVRLDSNCHTAVHQVEASFKNKKRKVSPSDLAASLFPNSSIIQRRLLEFGATAALGRSSTGEDGEQQPDYSIFDTDDLVALAPARVHPYIRKMVNVVARQIKGEHGRSIGVSNYIKLLIEADLRRRGFNLEIPKKN